MRMIYINETENFPELASEQAKKQSKNIESMNTYNYQ